MGSFLRPKLFRSIPGGRAIRARLVAQTGVLSLPAWCLALVSIRSEGPSAGIFLAGALAQTILCLAGAIRLQSNRDRLAPYIAFLYIAGFGWLWLGRSVGGSEDGFVPFAQAFLLIGALLAFALQVVVDSGAHDWRRARNLARQLAQRENWPAELGVCRLLPEVKAFREALQIDATPALALLRNSRPQVQVAALAALEFRRHWRPGQAEMVLHLARQASQPAVRSAAISALANVDDRLTVERLAEFLRDPAAEVRQAASEAVFWDASYRWNWVRLLVRRALADDQEYEERCFLPANRQLPAEAIRDLSAWAAEKGFLAARSAMMLRGHYERVLAENADPGLLDKLRKQLADPHAAPALRIELADLLQQHGRLDRLMQELLLDPINPAPLRIRAADSLLGQGEHAGAVAALRDVARFPNREIALATAAVVQRRLGIDLGLHPDQPAPPVHSRIAADVTRRVMTWGLQGDSALPSHDSESLVR